MARKDGSIDSAPVWVQRLYWTFFVAVLGFLALLVFAAVIIPLIGAITSGTTDGWIGLVIWYLVLGAALLAAWIAED